MKTKNILFVALLVLLAGMVSCKKDHDIPTGTVLDAELSVSGTYNGHDYVDLGLPSGLLWATCNLGADNPEGYGDYFAWGETQPKDTYTSDNYTYSDNPAILPSDHDAATANWGSGWRMPTKEEWQELYNKTTVTWTQQNGVNGRLFTASNGNSLFLPAAGYRGYSSLYDAGSLGYYWSSSLGTDYPGRAWYFDFDSGGCYMDYGSRGCGRSVRGVRSTSQNYIVNVSANPIDGGTATGGGIYEQGQSCTLTATANTGYTFTNWTENGEVVSTNATYTFTVSADRTLVANFTYNGGDDHAYVDLGLPSGLLWATCNVGASTPEDYGDYFAWGETQPKDTYNSSTYQYYDGSNMTKYTGSDGLTTLLPEDDAATANWGSDWRMPTREEWQELYNNTTSVWTTQNGVDGWRFTASNGNSLFLPAAGCRLDNSLYFVGSIGHYWSSTLCADDPDYAWYFGFNSGDYRLNYLNRDSGRSVRGVRSARQN